MNLKTSSALLLMILLASCAIPAESELPTSLASPTSTVTFAPSETPTPKPTETPTLTPTPEVSTPSVMTWEQFGQITESNYAEFFTPMNQTEFDEFRAGLLKPENTTYTGAAVPVGVHMSNSSVSGYRMVISGYLDKGIFSPYLVNVDGQFILIIRVVVDTDAGKQLLPVVIDVSSGPGRSNDLGRYIAYDFNALANYLEGFAISFVFFIDKEDGLTSVERNLIDKIIDAQTGLEPLPSVGIEQ